MRLPASLPPLQRTFPPVILNHSQPGEQAAELLVLVLVSRVADEEPVSPFLPGSLLLMTMMMMTMILFH